MPNCGRQTTNVACKITNFILKKQILHGLFSFFLHFYVFWGELCHCYILFLSKSWSNHDNQFQSTMEQILLSKLPIRGVPVLFRQIENIWYSPLVGKWYLRMSLERKLSINLNLYRKSECSFVPTISLSSCIKV